MSKLKLFFIFLIVTWILGTIIFIDFKKEIFEFVSSKRKPKMEEPKELEKLETAKKPETVEKKIPKKQENVKTEEKKTKNVDLIGEKLKKIKQTSPLPGVFDVYNYQTVKIELKIDVRKFK
jgi:hypothetical protein